MKTITRTLSLCFALWLTAIPGAAAQLTVCGVLDGAAGDLNPLAGAVTTSCTFGATGSFSGTVSESADPLNYRIFVQGSFQGSGTAASFVTGAFSLSGLGDLYPYIPFGGQLAGPPGAIADSGDFFRLAAEATNILGSAFGTVYPVQPGFALPQAVSSSLGNLANGVFSGPGTLTAGISFRAQPNASFVFNSGGPTVLASTDPVHVIPEPSTSVLLGTAALAWTLRLRLGRKLNGR